MNVSCAINETRSFRSNGRGLLLLTALTTAGRSCMTNLSSGKDCARAMLHYPSDPPASTTVFLSSDAQGNPRARYLLGSVASGGLLWPDVLLTIRRPICLYCGQGWIPKFQFVRLLCNASVLHPIFCPQPSIRMSQKRYSWMGGTEPHLFKW